MQELSGHLIKSGKFYQAIEIFFEELELAVHNGVITYDERKALTVEFSLALLNPSRFREIQDLGNKMLLLALRTPEYVKDFNQKDFNQNVKDSKK